MIFIRNIFKKISLREMAQDHLEEAERKLMHHEASECFHRHKVAYYNERIIKLREQAKA